jgi:uncharacterized membrane protein (UPF0127 family)
VGATVTRVRPGEPDPASRRSQARYRIVGAEWDLGSPRLMNLTRRAAIILVVVGICGFLIDGASRAQRPSLMPSDGRVTEAGLSGFGAALLTVEPGTGLKASAPRCVLTARTAQQQTQGLRGQPSLHHFAGLLLEYSKPTAAAFSERGDDLALSVAWFDRSGRYIAAANARVCRTDGQCVSYAAGRAYQYALEVPAGKLGSLGVGPGAQLHLGGPCNG